MQKSSPRAYIIISSDPNQVQKGSAHASQILSSIVKTCIGPRAMYKMVLTKINSIELTNDGNSILREIDVAHPSARCLIELSQTQDDECGDGTTSVLVLASTLLTNIVGLLNKYHPIRICNALNTAKNIALGHLENISVIVDDKDLLKIVTSSVATKLCNILKVPISELALKSVSKVMDVIVSKKNETIRKINIKTDIKVCSILGQLDESEMIEGVFIEKEIVHSQMRRLIQNPKILVMDASLEFKKGESVTNIELKSGSDFVKALEMEEDQIRRMCSIITSLKPVNRIENLSSKHLGQAGVFEYIKIGKDHYYKISNCVDPKAVTVVLRGPSKDLLTELERNFMDAAKVAKNALLCP